VNLPEFLTQDPDGEIRLVDHRIGLYTVVRCYQESPTAEQIAEEFPSLPLALVKEVLGFYQENQAEVDAYVAAYRAELERQAAAPPGPGVLKVRRFLRARGQVLNR
jgi:uncharacterized protein (DUF433 family)